MSQLILKRAPVCEMAFAQDFAPCGGSRILFTLYTATSRI
jgi:hypothetical protein